MQQESTGKKIHPASNQEAHYDLWDDWELIESSFLSQYGIRLREDGESDLSWSEFLSLLGGLMPDTPLGRVIAIRSETDPKRIKEMSKEQRKLRSDWILKRNERIKKEDPQKYQEYWKGFQDWAKNTFSAKKEGE